jgi:hypothetical protein
MIGKMNDLNVDCCCIVVNLKRHLASSDTHLNLLTQKTLLITCTSPIFLYNDCYWRCFEVHSIPRYYVQQWAMSRYVR